MDINSILSPYGIFSNYDVTSKTAVAPEKNFRSELGKDTYSAGRKQLMSTDMYNYGNKLMNISKAKNEVDAIKISDAKVTEGANESDAPGSAGGGGDSSDGEAKTEVETKVINGQVYMIVTTTEKDGTKTVEKIKVGGNNANGKESENEGDSLVEAVTM